ncbi:hypothetical protein [Streptomyces sp. NPDC091278]|uniref:hypothetical protein n=1 Tax=Streptomyces sp. NPDC091278 TaxID=3155301 RepID=UPI00344F25D5
MPEAGVNGFESLSAASITLARALGVCAPVEHSGLDEAIEVTLGLLPHEDGLRPRLVVRYLYRTLSTQCVFAPDAPQVWVDLAEVDSHLARRVHDLLALSAAR